MRYNRESQPSTVRRMVHISMPWQYLPKYLDLVLEHRFNLEIGLGGAEMDALSRAEARATAAVLHKEGIQITFHGPFWDLCAGSTDPLIRQVTRARLQQVLDLVSIFDALQVVCHTGYDPRHHGDWQRFLDVSLATWEPLVERAESLKVPLLLENVWEHGPQLHHELFAQLPSPYLGFCLDVGHQHSFSRTELPEWIEALSGHLREIHIHDNNGSGDAHLPVGRGTIDFKGLFRQLNECGKKPLLTLEPHRESHLFESLGALGNILEDSGWLSEEREHGHCGTQHRPDRASHHQPQPLCGPGS